MPSKSLLDRGFPSKAEKISEQYRSTLGISKFDPLDAFSLASYLKVTIFGIDELASDLVEKDFTILKNPEKFSAMWMPNDIGKKIILHNTCHSEKRQQSNLMHELAHIILEHNIPNELAQLCFTFGLHYFNPKHEQEAKYLGGCLQITRPGLQWALKHSFSEDQMSDYYNASVDMIKYRLNVTGVLVQRKYQLHK